MTAKRWKTKIKKACIQAGTYRPCFDAVIATLADILEKRDNAQELFVESGGNTIVTQTNKGGNEYIAKNPALVIIDDLNKTSLSYWRDLGLTPKGLKAIDEQAMKKPKASQLAEALRELGC